MPNTFRFRGRSARAFERVAGPIIQFSVPLQDGTWLVFTPLDPALGFQPGEHLGGGARHTRQGPDRPRGAPKYTALETESDRARPGRPPRRITDVRALRALRADPHWEEI